MMDIQKTPAEESLGFLLPSRKVESFHYTDLRSLLRNVPDPASGSIEEIDYTPIINTHLVSFKNGERVGNQSLPSGIFMSSGSAKPASSGMDDAVVSINAASPGDVTEFVISTDVTTEMPLGLGHLATSGGRSGVFHKVAVKKGIEAQVVERHTSLENLDNLSTVVSELIVEEGASVNWFIVQQENENATRLARLQVHLAKDSKVSVFVLNAGGKLVRQEILVSVNGENADLKLRGVNLIGDGAHIDVTTILEHNVPNTTAEELFRNVVAGDGHGIFQGQIKVAQPAQKTDAQMACNTLLLTDDGDFSAKPELEIFADDVICAHGATVADIEDEQLFYLRSRGIDEKTARALLIKAFVDEVVEELDAAEAIEEALVGVIDSWLDESI